MPPCNVVDRGWDITSHESGLISAWWLLQETFRTYLKKKSEKQMNDIKTSCVSTDQNGTLGSALAGTSAKLRLISYRHVL
jgi:hypothetical protein